MLFYVFCCESESEVNFCRSAPENPDNLEKPDIVIIAMTITVVITIDGNAGRILLIINFFVINSTCIIGISSQKFKTFV